MNPWFQMIILPQQRFLQPRLSRNGQLFFGVSECHGNGTVWVTATDPLPPFPPWRWEEGGDEQREVRKAPLKQRTSAGFAQPSPYWPARENRAALHLQKDLKTCHLEKI